MNDIENTPLGEFKKKARNITLGAVALAIVFAVAAGCLMASAQNNYSRYSTFSDYGFGSSDRYLDDYVSDSTGSSLCIYVAVAAAAVAGVASVAWVGSVLLIANRQTALALNVAQASMELDNVIDGISIPVGSILAFRRENDVVVVTNFEGKPIGALRPEFVGRLKAVVSARAIIEGYRGEHPIIRLVS